MIDNSKMNILISSRSFGKIQSGAIDLIKEQGLNPVLNPHGRKLNENELIGLLDGVVGIIAGTEEITGKVINSSNQLKVISRYGIGINNIDIKSANDKGILVYNTPDCPVISVSELTLSLILNLLRKISNLDRKIRKNLWAPEIGNLLSGKTVGIIGLGKIGKKLAQLLTVFDLKLLAYEINPDKDFTSKYKIRLVSLNELLSNSDIITLHIPLTDKTKNIIGENELMLMKKNAILINTARGGLIDEDALYKFLKERKISGAAIDAFEEEPYKGRLKDLDNVILTPHIGTYTVETRKDMELEAVKNLLKGLKEVGYL